VASTKNETLGKWPRVSMTAAYWRQPCFVVDSDGLAERARETFLDRIPRFSRHFLHAFGKLSSLRDDGYKTSTNQ
jgi:hypothetical protein